MKHKTVRIQSNRPTARYDITLDLEMTYRELLQIRLERLEWFVANNSLANATRLINKEARFPVSPEDVHNALCGERGWINSTRLSLEGKNPWAPSRPKLTRSPESPFLVDDKGVEHIRGVLISGDILNPHKGSYSEVRFVVQDKLNLPRYVSHIREAGDIITLDPGAPSHG